MVLANSAKEKAFRDVVNALDRITAKQPYGIGVILSF